MPIYRTTTDATGGIAAGAQDGELEHPPEAEGSGKRDEYRALDEYRAHMDEAAEDEVANLRKRQGWELKKLSETCKVLREKGLNSVEHNGRSYGPFDTQDNIRLEWARRKRLERDNPEQALRETADRDEISERTGKPKKAPRGKPFGKGSDSRRLQEQGEGGDEQGENESDGQGEGDGKSESSMPPEPEPTDNPLDDHIRKIARQEDAKLAKAIDANFGALAREIQKVKAIAAKGGGSKQIEIKLPTGETRKIDGLVHGLMPEILETVQLFPNTMLVGPAGCGKTHVAEQVAVAMGYHVAAGDPASEFSAVSCSIGMSESALTGRLLPLGENGQFKYAIAEFVRLYENGGLFLLDEMDACDPNVLITINAAIANGRLPLPQRVDRPIAVRHPKFKLMAAANTYGHGANRLYVGRNQLDATTTNRFTCATLDMDYDRELEASMCDSKEWLRVFWGVRDKINTLQMRRIWSTRTLIGGATWLAAGKSIPWILQRATVDWTPDDRAKAGIAK